MHRNLKKITPSNNLKLIEKLWMNYFVLTNCIYLNLTYEQELYFPGIHPQPIQSYFVKFGTIRVKMNFGQLPLYYVLFI
jgi:hypothetical protein